MSKTRIFVFVLVGLAVGFAAGMEFGYHLSGQTEHRLQIWEQESRADMAVRALRLIRHDSTNTAAFLEVNLDDAVSTLGVLVAEIPESRRTQRDLDMIKIVKSYRAEYPHRSESPTTDQRVNEAFSLVDGKSKH